MIVGISGKAETGKDFIATNHFNNRGFKPWSLAWHFKVWIVGQGLATYEEVFVTKPPHVRNLLQQYGTEQGRNVYGEDIWCNTAAAWIRLLSDQWGQRDIVIPDVRFPNEVALVHRLGGKVLRIVAPNRADQSRLTAAARVHPSETSLDTFEGFDGKVYNDFEEHREVGGQVNDLLVEWGWETPRSARAVVGVDPARGEDFTAMLIALQSNGRSTDEA